MSIHIGAIRGEIAKTVLLPGDPLRAKYISDNFLEKSREVSNIRGIHFFTGKYKEKEVTIGASGMGIPSMGIYSYELYTEYEVDTIIRMGTCGSYRLEIGLQDLINVRLAASESTYARYAFGIEEESLSYQGDIYHKINTTAKSLGTEIRTLNVHTSDIFYRPDPEPVIAKKYACDVVEMETFGLFANAKYLKKNAASILSVTDILPTGEIMSAKDRERSLNQMITLSLESV
ncbi:MAG: purine-nucleoside phosphorylase [Bergeyella sp.]|nr:purine-nucleoside phosphorylase [Bergeyella sp.]